MLGLPPSVVPSLIGLLLIVFVVRRNLVSRKLNMDRMLVLPVVLVLVAGYQFATDPPHAWTTWAVLLAALGAGGLVGWHRGKLTAITHDPQTGELTAQPSIAAVILIVAVFALRFGLRFWFASQPGQGHTHVAVLATNALLLSTVGVLSAQRIEMYLRCRRLLSAAAGAAA